MSDLEFSRRVRHFRYAAYGAFSLIVLALASDADPPGPPLLLAGLLIVLCAAVSYLGAHRGGAVRWLEYLAIPFLVAVTGLPLLPALAAMAVLLAGTVALLGFRSLPGVAGAMLAGGLAGRALAFEVTYVDRVAADVLPLLFVVIFSTPLAAWGYEETIRQRRSRAVVEARREDLERHRNVLVRYLPDDLPARLAAGAIAPARRWLTVAAVDVEDFTVHLEHLAPEDLVRVLDDVYGLLAELAAGFGGVLHKFLGDGALICFGAEEERGRRLEAAQCLAMVRVLPVRVNALNGAWRADGVPASLHVRAGVASGFCTLGALGRGRRHDFTLVGLPVNLASRLQALAPRDRAAVDAATGALLDEALGETRSTSVKGFARPVCIHVI